jgi:hypothetical protein
VPGEGHYGAWSARVFFDDVGLEPALEDTNLAYVLRIV